MKLTLTHKLDLLSIGSFQPDWKDCRRYLAFQYVRREGQPLIAGHTEPQWRADPYWTILVATWLSARADGYELRRVTVAGKRVDEVGIESLNLWLSAATLAAWRRFCTENREWGASSFVMNNLFLFGGHVGRSREIKSRSRE